MPHPHHCLPARDTNAFGTSLPNGNVSSNADPSHQYPSADAYTRAIPNSLSHHPQTPLSSLSLLARLMKHAEPDPLDSMAMLFQLVLYSPVGCCHTLVSTLHTSHSLIFILRSIGLALLFFQTPNSFPLIPFFDLASFCFSR